jgi:erythromycin esterase
LLIKDYVRSNTVKISTIDTANDNYSDLAIISRAIGEAKVVMLGKQDHGDAPAFLPQSRIIKYLHEQKRCAKVLLKRVKPSEFYINLDKNL